MVEKGIFIVRFKIMENKDKVVDGGNPFFDGKPIMVKPCCQEIDLNRDEGSCQSRFNLTLFLSIGVKGV